MSAPPRVKVEGSASTSSSSKPAKPPKEVPKIACSRCRSLKAKCSGPVSGAGDRCAKCIKAGPVECTWEQHKRGRKVGTRLSDPTKALMRMKAAYEIISNSQKEDGKDLIQIPEELALVASSASSSKLVLPPSAISPASGSASATSSRSPSSHHLQDLSRDSPVSASITSPSYTSPYPPPPPPAHHHYQQQSGPSLPSRFQLPPPLPSNFASRSLASSSTIPNFLLPQPDPPPPSFHIPQHLQTQHHPGYTFPPPMNHYSPTPPPPPFPAQFRDLGPSSRSSPSLARLFAMKPPDEQNAHATDLDLWRQDPVQLGYLTESASRELFDLFHASINPRICVFDQNLHTHDYVRARSQLLFAVILSVALKFSTAHGDPITRSRCLALARDQILRIISDDGGSSVENVQALLLLVEYKEKEDEQAYVLLGMACRIAMDLDCGQPIPQPEILNRNRLRTWFAAFNADRRFGGCGQVSKPTIMPEDASVRNSSTFHRNPIATPYDARLVAAVHLRRLMSRYDVLIKSNSERPGGNESTPLLNLREAFVAVDQELTEWNAFWTGEIKSLNPHGDTLQLILNQEHGKLQIAHHWLFQAFRFPTAQSPDEWEIERREALAACLGGSCRILRLMCTVPDVSLSYNLFYSYATFFLHKMFKARLLEIQLIDSTTISSIFEIIRQAAEKLEGATLDPGHTIALHASLLRSLLTFTPRGSPGPRSSPGASLPTPPTFNLINNPKLNLPPKTNLNSVYFPPPPSQPLSDQRYSHGSGSMFRPNSAEEGRGLSTPTSAMRGGEDEEENGPEQLKAQSTEGVESVSGVDSTEGGDWSELWMEGGVFDAFLPKGDSDLNALDYAFFDFQPPD